MWPFRDTVGGMMLLPVVELGMNIVLHFVILSCILLLWHQLETASTIVWGRSGSIDFPIMYARMSSAYFWSSVWIGRVSLMSMMKSRKRTGPRTLPWTTPASTFFHSVKVVPMTTRCLLSWR